MIIRNLKESDINSLLDLMKKVFPDIDVSSTAHRLINYYPMFSLRDSIIVFDTIKNNVLAYLCLIRGVFVFNRIEIPFGQMEMVGTNPNFRHRGLIRELNHIYEELASEYNLPILIIHGIPYFYRQFKYEFALPSESSLVIALELIPPLKNGEFEPVTIEKVNDRNLFESFLSCREKRNSFLDLYRKVDIEHWDYIYHGKLGEAGGMDLYLLKKDGEFVGCFYLEVFFKTIQIRELWLESVHYIPSILRFVMNIARSFNFPLCVSRPAQESLVPYFERITETKFPIPYAFYVKIPSIKQLLILITPVLETRLAASEFKEITDSITLSCYTEGFTLNFENGKLKEVEQLKKNELGESHIRIPPLIVYQLLLGYRTLNELEEIYPDVSVNALYKSFIQILFPKIKTSITPSL